LLADEPTAHLDSQRTVEILELFQEICREHETAVLLATHNRLAADYADRVYELGDGRVQQRSSLSPL
jgi:putative ABC transport system ATP-binding protein